MHLMLKVASLHPSKSKKSHSQNELIITEPRLAYTFKQKKQGTHFRFMFEVGQGKKHYNKFPNSLTLTGKQQQLQEHARNSYIAENALLRPRQLLFFLRRTKLHL